MATSNINDQIACAANLGLKYISKCAITGSTSCVPMTRATNNEATCVATDIANVLKTYDNVNRGAISNVTVIYDDGLYCGTYITGCLSLCPVTLEDEDGNVHASGLLTGICCYCGVAHCVRLVNTWYDVYNCTCYCCMTWCACSLCGYCGISKNLVDCSNYCFIIDGCKNGVDPYDSNSPYINIQNTIVNQTHNVDFPKKVNGRLLVNCSHCCRTTTLSGVDCTAGNLLYVTAGMARTNTCESCPCKVIIVNTKDVTSGGTNPEIWLGTNEYCETSGSKVVMTNGTVPYLCMVNRCNPNTCPVLGKCGAAGYFVYDVTSIHL